MVAPMAILSFFLLLLLKPSVGVICTAHRKQAAFSWCFVCCYGKHKGGVVVVGAWGGKKVSAGDEV